MEKDNQLPGKELPAGNAAHRLPESRRLPGRRALLGLSVLLAVSLVLYLLRDHAPETAAQQKDEAHGGSTAVHFAGWTKPELVIVATGQMHGYVQPCGCSHPQYGGLERRYNFIQSLRDKGWPVVPLDYGELAQTHGPQAMQKYVTSMKALKAMGYGAIGLGKTEFNMPLFQALAHYSVNDPLPTPVATNLLKTAKGQEFHDLNVRQVKIIDTTSPKLGVVSVTDPKLQVADSDCKFTSPIPTLAPILADVRGKAQLIVLLYQGTDSNQEAVKFITDFNDYRKQNAAQNIPGISFVLCLSSDPEPPGRPKAVGGTQIVTVGHKGRYVGVIGLFKAKQNNAYELKYELVAIGPEHDLAKGKRNPVSDLMEEYTRKVKDEDYVAKFPRGPHPLQAQLASMNIETKYVGSEICQNCHAHAYKVWEGHKHSHAFESLVKATHPSLRQFDGECVVCHTVGFQYNTGYHDKSNTAKTNGKLLNVGCENCHGPASAHVNNPQNADLYPLINPLSTKRVPKDQAANPNLAQAFVKRRMIQIDSFCQKCHDLENDVHWGNVNFLEKWKHVDHNFPPRPLPQAANKNNPPPNVGGLKVNADNAKK